MNLSLRRLITGIASPLALAGALVGFYLLVYLLSDATSSGPDDLLAPTPSEGQFIVLPTGAGLVAFAIAGLSILLAIVVLSSPSYWTRRGHFLFPRRSIAIGAVFGITLVGAGLYLAFSGMLTQGLSYEQHLTEREFIDTKALSVMIAFFLSILLVALLGPRFLPVILLLWLLAALLFGFFSSRSLTGLDLFDLPDEMEKSIAFASEVEKYRDPQRVLAEAAEKAGQQSGGGGAETSQAQGASNDGDGAETSQAQGASNDGDGADDAYFESGDQIETTIDRLLNARDPQERADMARALAGVATEEALRALAESMFDDPHPLVQETALGAMVEADLELLSDTLLDHRDPQLRKAAAAALAEKDDVNAVASLVKALDDDLDPEVRSAVAEALGELGDQEALVRALMEDIDPSEEVRQSVVEALSEPGSSGALEPLLTILESDSSLLVRATAADALGEFDTQAAIEGLAEALAGDSETDVRAAAGSALGDILDVETISLLKEAREADSEAAVRAAAAESLDKFSSDQLQEALVDSADEDIRADAAQLLGERGSLDAAPALVEALSDVEATVRKASRDSLGKLGTLTSLENGSALFSAVDDRLMAPGVTTEQATDLPHIPLFEIEGTEGVDFLRTAVGDNYFNGQWAPDYSVKLAYAANESTNSSQGIALTTETAERSQSGRITARSLEEAGMVFQGVVPITHQSTSISEYGTFYPDALIFAIEGEAESYHWDGTSHEFSTAQLNAATASRLYPYATEYGSVSEHVSQLSGEIIAGNASPYAQAKAIEQYLRSNYRYRLGSPTEGGAPEGSDPVAYFLFESREGTCGNFSSAFVILARAAGLPARVVSGWSITPTAEAQVVYSDQAHQRAEVAFEGLGWVLFEPTPPEGPSGRAAENSPAEAPQAQREQEELQDLVEQLASGTSTEQREAKGALEDLGADLSEAENGSDVVSVKGEPAGMVPGTTTMQSAGSSAVPLFRVSGSANTSYLRMAVGEVYNNGSWQQLDPISVRYHPGKSIPHLVQNEIAAGIWSDLPAHRLNKALLARYDIKPPVAYTDTITIEPLAEGGVIPAGIVATSKFLDQVGHSGHFRPFSGTFVLDVSTESYTWDSQIPAFSREQLLAAPASRDSTYIQLPSDLPARISELAQSITQGETTVYGKARALENHLKSAYTYAFASKDGSDAPPPGHDPVDWFLFESRQGTCGNFSSSFVVLARSVGVPARVVSGWSIRATSNTQTVQLDQAHQWVEVAFEGLGWITFEPTASGGPLTRALELGGEEDSGDVQDYGGSQEMAGGPEPEPEAETKPPEQRQPKETVIEITQWPVQVTRHSEFAIGGTLVTVDGSPVSGLDVEIFVNETKDHGGTKIGQVTAQAGAYQALVALPAALNRGNYQLLAHAIGNEEYGESWSDPDLTVLSESGLELTGPREVHVDRQAVFLGRVYDDTGGGVIDSPVQVSIDGRELPSQTTNPAGEFSFAHTFTEPGPHQIEVTFQEREFVLGNSASFDLVVVMPTQISLETPGQVLVKEEYLISGQLVDVRNKPLANESVNIQVGSKPEQELVTDDSGRFELSRSASDAGDFSVIATFEGEYPVLPTAVAANIVSRHMTSLSITGPGEVLLGSEATFVGTVSSGTLTEIAMLPVAILDSDGNVVETATTDAGGTFKYEPKPFDETGMQLLTARFEGDDYITPSSASVFLAVLAPTSLNVEGPELSRTGEAVELKGRLLDGDGQPVPFMEIWSGDLASGPTITEEDGSFSRQFSLSPSFTQSEVEVSVDIPFEFNGTDRYAPTLAVHTVAVGIPWLVVEPVEPVARGDNVLLRGGVYLGNGPLSGEPVTVADGHRATTLGTGAFLVSYPTDGDTPLGKNEVAIFLPGHGVSAIAGFEIKSRVNLTAIPLEKVRPGRSVPMHVIVHDDTDTGLAGALIRTSQGEEATTDAQGVALFTLTVPGEDGILSAPITFTYDGDDLRLPLSYFMGVPITPASFNWLLWVVMPLLLVTVVVAWNVGRLQTGTVSLPFNLPFAMPGIIPAQEGSEGKPDAASEGLDEELSPGVAPKATQLCIACSTMSPDLPLVWGSCEQIRLELWLSEVDGPPVSGATLEIQRSGCEPEEMSTDSSGTCQLEWVAAELGEVTVLARFCGSRSYEPTSAALVYRVVDFREEIVQLYDRFLDWALAQFPDTEGKTPREIERLLTNSGMAINHGALDEVITRFEEADYSEHLIGREEYEAMHRSWMAVTGD